MKLKISLLIVPALLISACINDPRGDIYDGGLSDLTNNGGIDLSTTDDEYVLIGDPKTCEEARRAKSYMGCDYWPTVQATGIWPIFDFAAVVSNVGDTPAEVKVTGPNNVNQMVQVAPNSLQKIYLPWVQALKQVDSNSCGSTGPLPGSVLAEGGAYHLTSSVPVVVYQFSPIEYKGEKGPPGKNWSTCPGKTTECPAAGRKVGCYAFSADASLLIPSTAMTPNYVVTSAGAPNSYVSITATQMDTDVFIQIPNGGATLAGSSIPAASAGQKFHLFLNAGDVAQLVVAPGKDLSGMLMNANLPIQVISGTTILLNPPTSSAGDHSEEIVFPAETLGSDYIVTVPTGPNDDPVGHSVRIYGNPQADTHLTFNPPLSGVATTIPAGKMIEIGVIDDSNKKPFNKDFEVKGDKPFAIASFMLNSSIVDPGDKGTDNGVLLNKGDPSQTVFVPIEQYRDKYVFLAPDDFLKSYVDIIMPMDAKVTVDGKVINDKPKAIGTSGFGVLRRELDRDKDPKGVHKVSADKPVGIQVMGYAVQTSFHYPGGLNTKAIAPPPIIM